MKLLLDTHIFIWLIDGNQNLSLYDVSKIEA
jgi:PIN domain nuclease of toxin-antitoxin system